MMKQFRVANNGCGWRTQASKGEEPDSDEPGKRTYNDLVSALPRKTMSKICLMILLSLIRLVSCGVRKGVPKRRSLKDVGTDFFTQQPGS
jgi:hypothetical protein